MRWNPCGRIVDYGSRPFRATYRPFRDSDQEVEIEWFPAAPGALPLAMPSNITIPYWEQDQFGYDDDELPLNTAEPTGKPVVRPGTGRGHVCGSAEDFREGGLYEPGEPAVEYGQQGLPRCCMAPVIGRGLVRDSGACGVFYSVIPAADCEDAPIVAMGGDASAPYPPYLGWLRWPIVAGRTYRVTATWAPEIVPQSVAVLEGATCGTAVFLTAINQGAPPYEFTATVSGWCYVVDADVNGPTVWTRTVEDIT